MGRSRRKGGFGIRGLVAAVKGHPVGTAVELVGRNGNATVRDRRGRTLAHHAVERREGVREIILALVAGGLDVDAADRDGDTALHRAAFVPNPAAFAALVECGARPHARNVRGTAALGVLGTPTGLASPYDGIAKFIFDHQPMKWGLLELMPAVGVLGEDATVERFDGEMVPHALSHRLRSDMVLVLTRRDARPAAFIIEFQSRVDKGMAERIAAYRIEFARGVRRNHPELVGADGRVPFILGAVVHAGSEPWNAATDSAALMDRPHSPDLEAYGISSRYYVIDVQRTDFSRHPGNPAAAYFRLLQGDPADMLRAARELDALLPLDRYSALRHLMRASMLLGVDIGKHPEIEKVLEGPPEMSAFAEYLNNALAEAKDAKAEAEAAKAGERKLVSDVIALRFDRTIADRIRPILEAMDDSEGIYDVRSRALESASAEEFLSQLGLLNGHGPAAKN